MAVCLRNSLGMLGTETGASQGSSVVCDAHKFLYLSEPPFPFLSKENQGKHSIGCHKHI